MTVANTTARKTFAGNDVTTSFDTSPMVFFDATDLTVYVVTTATGAVVATLTLTTDYTVTGGSGSTGTVATTGLYGAPATGQTLVIVRSLPRLQEADFENNDPNDADVAEEVADRIIMIAQEHEAKFARTARLADTDVTGADVTLPTPVAGEVLKWNSAGTGLESAVASDLDLTLISGTGLLSRSGTTVVGRTLTGTTAEITVTNGTGVSGNPTISLPSAITLTGKTMTGGSFAGVAALALALGSDADGDTYYRASNAHARLAKGAANTRLFMNAGATAPEWASGIKIGSFTRDNTAASGGVAYTGVGFKPSAIVFLATAGVSKELSIGVDDGTTHGCIYHDGNGSATSGANAIAEDQTGGASQTAVVASFDVDGFTLTWTKSGAPSGTTTVKYIAFR